MKNIKVRIQSYLTNLETRFATKSPNIIIVNYYDHGFKTTILDLKNKLHRDDALLLGCNPHMYRNVEKAVGTEVLALISEDIPLGFHDATDPLKWLYLPSNTIFNLNRQYAQKLVDENDFHVFQRDNGFLQAGDIVESLPGNRWNAFGTFPIFDEPMLDGGNFVHNGKDALLTMSTMVESDKRLTEVEHHLRHQQLFPLFNIRSMATFPNLQEYFGIPHADMCSIWLNENTFGTSMFVDHRNEIITSGRLGRANKILFRTGKCAQDHFQSILKREINWIPIPCYGPTKLELEHGNGRGLYTQAVITDNAIYVPQFANKLDDASSNDDDLETKVRFHFADAIALMAYEEAEKTYGHGRSIIPIDSTAKMLGGLHCLTTQLKGAPAMRLIKDLKEKGAKVTDVDHHLYVV